jgi:hypothetical protein
MATVFDLSENTAPDGTDRLYITDGTNDEGVEIANLLKGSGAEVPAAKITGTVAHERGGLEADVSAYDGLVKISGGTTSAVADPNQTVTTKGDILVRDASELIRLGVGANNQVLTADSAEASGVKWADAGGGGVKALYMNILPSGPAITSRFTTVQSSTTVHYQQASIDNTYNTMGGRIILPSDLTSIDAIHLALSSSISNENGITIVCSATAQGENFGNGGSFGNVVYAANTWYPITASAIYLLDISSALPPAVAADDVFQLTIKVTDSTSSTTYAWGCYMEYS